MNEEMNDLKWKLNDLDHKDPDGLSKKVGFQGIALLTMGLVAFLAVLLGSIIYYLINWLAGKIIDWNILKIVKNLLNTAKKLDEEFFYGRDLTK